MNEYLNRFLSEADGSQARRDALARAGAAQREWEVATFGPTTPYSVFTEVDVSALRGTPDEHAEAAALLGNVHTVAARTASESMVRWQRRFDVPLFWTSVGVVLTSPSGGRRLWFANDESLPTDPAQLMTLSGAQFVLVAEIVQYDSWGGCVTGDGRLWQGSQTIWDVSAVSRICHSRLARGTSREVSYY